MSKTVIFDDEFITVWYYPEDKIIHHQFHKYTQGQTLRDAFSAGAEILEKNRAQKWLSDDRLSSVINEEDMKWTSTVWRPLVTKAGWKYWALVLPEKAVGKLNMNRIIKDYANTGVTVKTFSEPDEGLKWLKDQ
ncbi:hypothetical protein ACFL2O_07115 [Thermodesulfobacteriota bacterium]